jgi:hypothetical protein
MSYPPNNMRTEGKNPTRLGNNMPVKANVQIPNTKMYKCEEMSSTKRPKAPKKKTRLILNVSFEAFV